MVSVATGSSQGRTFKAGFGDLYCFLSIVLMGMRAELGSTLEHLLDGIRLTMQRGKGEAVRSQVPKS